MLVEIWSDVVCPWCYIGKRRFEQALGDFPHKDEVDVVYRSFELDPAAPTEPTETVVEALGRKYGGGAAAGRRMVEGVAQARSNAAAGRVPPLGPSFEDGVRRIYDQHLRGSIHPRW